MTFLLYLVLTICILALVAVAVLQQHRRERMLATDWQPVDFRAVARLLDRSDDEFLARHLRRLVLLRLRFTRALAAEHYLAPLNANCERAIAAARLKPNEEELFRAATLLRMEITRLRWRVWLGVLWSLDTNVEKIGSLLRLLPKQNFIGH